MEACALTCSPCSTTPNKLSVEIFSDINEVAIKVEQLLNSVLMVVVDVLEFKGEQAIKLEYKVLIFEQTLLC